MRKGRRRRGGIHRHQAISAINMTPFIDVMLVLLIIFMVAMPTLEASVDVGGNPASTTAPSDPEPVTVALLSAEGSVIFKRGGYEMPAAYGQLDAGLTAFGRPKTGKVYVRAEDCAAYGRYFRVMKELDKAGFTPVLVAARQGAPGKAGTKKPVCPSHPESTTRGD